MPDLLEPEFQGVFNTWKSSPSPAASGAMLRAVRPVIDSALKSYAGNSSSPLLLSRARRMALDAMHTYDPAKAGLKTHLLGQLRGLHRVGVQQNQIIAIPEQIQLDKHHVHEAENRLRDFMGRDPTDIELADETGLSPKRLGYIRNAHNGTPEGMMTTETGEEGYQPAVRPDPASDGWVSFVYGSLAPIDQTIMEHTFGLHGRKQVSGQVLARKLGITPAAVSQRKARIQKTLDSRDDLGIF